MEGKMKVGIMTEIGKIELIERDIPKMKDDEVLVKIEYVGICGSDLHFYEYGAIGDLVVKPPFVLGHEAGGIIIEIGKDVKNLSIGDKVALEPGITCGHCEFCREGKYNLCNDVVFFSAPPIDGAFQEYVAHKSYLCFKLPDNVSTLEGALIEPLAVGLHAANIGNARLGQTAFVIGSGCIGLCSMMALKAYGVSKVYVIDVLSKRLEKAMELGATGVINAKDEDVMKRVLELTNGMGSDLVIDTSGNEEAISQAIDFAKKGSTIVFVGYSATGMLNIPMSITINKELTIKTIFRYRHIYPQAIESVASGKVNLKDIATHIFDFKDVQKSMNESINDKINIVKSVIKIS